MKWYEKLNHNELEHVKSMVHKLSIIGWQRKREADRFHRLGCRVCQNISRKIEREK